jgi:leader peptidase (prepilin peptidase)/N-methyltransferase
MGTEEAVVAVGILGLLVGSFLNVVIVRLPRGESVVHPRSRCTACGERIRWYDNVPVLSYLLLRGRCRRCGTRISPRYALVELVTGAIFALLAWNVLSSGDGPMSVSQFLRLGVYLYLTASLVASTFIDLEHQIIPDAITIPGLILAPLLSLAVPSIHPDAATPLEAFALAILGGLLGAGGTWLVGALGKVAFRKEAMGFGDVKLMGMIGGILGWKGVALAFLIACIAGSVIGLVLLAITRNRYLPFAPYLSLGAMVVLLYGEEIEFFLRVTYPAVIRSWIGG